MAKDKSPDRANRLREAIASKLRQGEPEERSTATSRPAGAPTPGQAHVPRISVTETARHILGSRISIGGPKLQDLANMCRQLATLIDVGIPLLRSLKILSERTQHHKLRQVIREVAADVEQGNSLHSSLEKHSETIPALIRNIIRIGETGGILENALRRLADIYERKADIKRKVVAAMAYPIVAMLVAVSVVIAIMTYAVPVFAEVYSQKEGVELPKITQQIIAISDFIRFQWRIYIPVVLAISLGIYLYGKTIPGRRLYDRMRLKLPVMGGLNTKINVARATRTLANLLTAGIPLLEALSATAASSDNVIMAETLQRTREHVEQGGKMEESLRNDRVVPPIVVDMISIGDEAGALDTMLDRMADAYEGEVETGLKGLVALIEPLLIIFLGLVVIVIAFAILLPYWNIGDLIE